MVRATLWSLYEVQWDGLNELCGSVPADPEIIRAWLESRRPKARPHDGKTINEIQEEVLASVEVLDEAEFKILTFQRHDGQCVMRAGTIRAHIKECAKTISAQHVGRIEKERAFSTRVLAGVYLDETVRWVPILRPDGTPVTKHDGERDKPVRTRFGSALKRFEWIEPWRLNFPLKVLLSPRGGPSVAEEDLDTIFRYGGVHGYAGERGDGAGRYHFTITQIGEE